MTHLDISATHDLCTWFHERNEEPYTKMHHSEQKYADFCSEWCTVRYETSALWNLWIWSMVFQWKVWANDLCYPCIFLMFLNIDSEANACQKLLSIVVFSKYFSILTEWEIITKMQFSLEKYLLNISQPRFKGNSLLKVVSYPCVFWIFPSIDSEATLCQKLFPTLVFSEVLGGISSPDVSGSLIFNEYMHEEGIRLNGVVQYGMDTIPLVGF